MQKDNIRDIYSLSPLQEGLFFHSLADKSSAAYYIQVCYRIHGHIDPGCVEQALNLLAERYDVLRTSFVLEGLKKAFQVVLKERRPGFGFEDISGVQDKEAHLQKARMADKARSFDLTRDPLMRVLLFKLGEAEYEFIWSHHHIIMDGWCTGVVIKEFSEIYDSLLHGRKPALPPVVQYKEFIKWLERRDAAAAAGYWKTYLDGYDTKAGIQPPQARPATGYDNCEVMADVPAAVMDKLRRLCVQSRATLNSILQAAWGCLLARYAGQDDVVFGTVVSLRPPEISGVESMVGLFINTIPVRIQLNRHDSFTTLVAQVQQKALASDAHQYYPLADIQASSALRQHLLDHVFVLGNYPVADQLDGIRRQQPEEAVSITDVRAHEQVNYHFSINISGGDQLRIRFNYNGLVFTKAYIEQVAAHYLTILAAVAADPAQRLEAIQMLSAAEERSLLLMGKGPHRAYAGTTGSLFGERAAAQPGAVAVSERERLLTYAQLDEWSTALALAIQEAGVPAGGYVGVKAGRCADTVISLLGIAKAGCVYVPIEPDHPGERVNRMLGALPLQMLITTSAYLFDLPATDAPVFVTDLQLTAGSTAHDACRGAAATDIAYVIFTSGTTGQPKGIPVRQESIVDRARYHIEYLGIQPSDAILQLASVAFDASIIEILMTLLAGATLHIPTAQARQDPALLSEYIEGNNISIGIFPPAYLKLLDSNGLPRLRQVISTGEAAILKDMLAHAAQRSMHNGYGPTELCIGATFYTVQRERAASYLESGKIPIGQPFSNTAVYVLDHWGRLAPKGVAGELCAAGIGVTNGYIGDADLTARKFIDNTFDPSAGFSRIYKTGDLAYWNAQEELVCLGRIDEQVQVRGIRVELSEIEAALFQYAGIRQACVVPHVHEENTYLAAYVTPAGEKLSAEAIYAHLRNCLPEYMVPSQLTVLDKLPVTSSGKIDRQSLPAFDLAAAAAYEAPQNDTEALLCRIWADVLDRERVGRQDNFFAIGGHSLKATQIVSALYKNLGIRLDIGEIFAHPRVALLAGVVSAQQQAAFTSIQRSTAANHPVTPSQRRLWVLSQLAGAAAAYNMAGAYLLEGNVNVEAMRTAFAQLLQRHESLRTRFVLQGDALQQVVTEEITPHAFEHILTGDEHSTDALVEALARHSFDLEAGGLFRVQLLQYAPNGFVLACVMHHIISDGWSVRRMFHEISSYYNDIVQRKKTSVAPLPVQYRDYAAWLLNELQQEQLSGHRAYWLSQLRHAEPLQLVTDYPRPSLQTFEGAALHQTLDKNLLQRLRAFAQEKEMSVFMVLLSAIKILLHRFTRQERITVGSAVSGREHPEVQELIGCFINTIVLSTELNAQQTGDDLLSAVKRTMLDAYAHQSYPFDQLVEELNAERDLSRSAIFDVLVNHQAMNAADEQVSLAGLRVSKYNTGSTAASSKFDLEFECYEHTDELVIQLVYNTALFRERTIADYSRHLLHILEDLIAAPSQKIGGLGLQENGGFLRGPLRDYDIHAGYSVLFEQQAQRTPHVTAVEDAEESWTYAALLHHVDRIAALVSARLSAVPENAGKIVAVCAERSCRLVALAIGIWKAGGIYMPVDTALPAERMRYMLEDAPAALFITEKIMEGMTLRQAAVDDCFAPGAATAAMPSGGGAHDGAYVLYTSGSTGRPKGVQATGAGMLNHLHSKVEDLRLDGKSIVAQTASQGFDVSIWQTFAALLAGGQVRIYNRLQVMELHTHIAALEAHGVTVLQMVPSYLNEFLEELETRQSTIRLSSLSHLITAGEELSAALAERWFRRVPHAAIANCYGPTEATDNISIHIMRAWEGKGRVPVGRPLANMHLYVVDDQFRLCPAGVVGEICASGVGVSAGYIGHEREQSAKVFREDPFTAGRWLYRTGDLGRWNEDGIMEFHGRSDRQVKLRGQRIELGEIERAIQGFGLVKQCAVVFDRDQQGGSLCGYIVWKEQDAQDDRMRRLRAHLSGMLAAYMVPRQLMELPALPLTASGKVDRRRLPKQAAVKKSLLLPVGPLETQLLEIWKGILEKEDIGVEDSFFDLGGHSLKAMRLLAAVRQTTGAPLQLQEVFRFPTIRSQARLLETVTWVQSAGISGEPVSEEESIII